jgi:hypothetical protein
MSPVIARVARNGRNQKARSIVFTEIDVLLYKLRVLHIDSGIENTNANAGPVQPFIAGGLYVDFGQMPIAAVVIDLGRHGLHDRNLEIWDYFGPIS